MDQRHTRGNFSRKSSQSSRSSLRNAEKALVAYADKEQIVTSRDKDQQPLADSDYFSEWCASKGSDRAYSGGRAMGASIKDQGIGLAAGPERQIIQVLRERRAILASDYQEKLATFKPDYPDMRRLKAQIAQFDAEIDRAVTVIKGSLKAHYESLRQQEEMLQKNIEEARGKVLDGPKQKHSNADLAARG